MDLKNIKMKRKTKFEPKLKTIADKLWQLCRQIIFLTHGTDCYTCPQKKLTGRNLQCGHGYPAGALGVSMQYNLDILRPQCFQCNINYAGMQIVFWKNLEIEYGKEKADKLYEECQASKGKPIKARPHILALTEEYRQKLKTLIN